MDGAPAPFQESATLGLDAPPRLPCLPWRGSDVRVARGATTDGDFDVRKAGKDIGLRHVSGLGPLVPSRRDEVGRTRGRVWRTGTHCLLAPPPAPLAGATGGSFAPAAAVHGALETCSWWGEWIWCRGGRLGRAHQGITLSLAGSHLRALRRPAGGLHPKDRGVNFHLTLSAMNPLQDTLTRAIEPLPATAGHG